MTINDWMRAARARLEGCENPDAATDARLLVCGVCHLEPGQVRFSGALPLTDEQIGELNTRLQRRVDGEPLQYIEGEAWFMGLRFSVDARVLIPRQDTETLCEEALNALKGIRNPRVLDLCTGSGALAVAIKHYCPAANVTGADISPDALNVARKNAIDHRAEVRFAEGDGFEPVKGERFDLIVCNPPYLTAQDMNELQVEVQREPELALFGGADGMTFYRRFSRETPKFLAPGGRIMFEVGEGQAEDVLSLLKDNFPGCENGIIKDLCGIDRVVWIRSAE